MFSIRLTTRIASTVRYIFCYVLAIFHIFAKKNINIGYNEKDSILADYFV